RRGSHRRCSAMWRSKRRRGQDIYYYRPGTGKAKTSARDNRGRIGCRRCPRQLARNSISRLPATLRIRVSILWHPTAPLPLLRPLLYESHLPDIQSTRGTRLLPECVTEGWLPPTLGMVSRKGIFAVG